MRRLKWIRGGQRRVVRVHDRFAKIRVHFAKGSREICHRRIVSGVSLRLCAGPENIAPLRRANTFASAEPPSKIAGYAQMSEYPASGLVARRRREMQMLIAQTVEHRLRLEKQIPALSREYFTRHEEGCSRIRSNVFSRRC